MAKRTQTRIEQLLLNYHAERERERCDTERVAPRLDVDHILRSEALSPRDRQMLSLRYFCNLNQTECARILGISQQAVSGRIDKCMCALVDALLGKGYTSRNQNVQKRDYTCLHPDFDKWQIDVLYNIGGWWMVPCAVSKLIQLWFGLRGGPVELGDYSRERKHEYPIITPHRWNGMDLTYRKPKEIHFDELNL